MFQTIDLYNPPPSHGRVVVLANGDFPSHPLPLSILTQAEVVVCCDGAAQKLLDWGREPDFITGDMDSLPSHLYERFSERIIPSPCQETNDLTKAVRLCIEKGYKHLHILGATGGREDHALANISLLTEYAQFIKVEMITDHGTFIPLLESGAVATQSGTQISIFSLDPDLSLRATGLKYPVSHVRFDSWWKGSLNEATGERCSFQFSKGRVLLYIAIP